MYRRLTASQIEFFKMVDEKVASVSAYSNFLLLFLPCDVMHSAVLAIAQCLYVYLSVTLMYCIETAKYVIKLFLGLVVPSF